MNVISINTNDICYRDYKAFSVIYDLRNKNIIRLDMVAADIFDFIAKNKTVNTIDIIKNVAERYDCQIIDIEDDIIEFLEELFREGIIQVQGDYYDIPDNEKSTVVTDETDYEGEIIQSLQEEGQLYSATLELTYLCNEKCVHCYAREEYCDESISKNLSIEQYKQIIDELFELNCMHIAFTGGDPFVYDGFYEVFKYARSKQFVCDIFTNGLMLNNEILLNKMVNLRPRAFYISIYGATPKTHDDITGVKGSFEKTICAIKALKKYDVSVVLNIMVLTINHHELEAITKMAESLDIEYRVSLSIIYKNDGSDAPMQYFLNDKNNIKRCLLSLPGKLYAQDKSIEQTTKGKYMCNAGITTLSIDPGGVVYPCVSLKQPLGDISNTNLKEIWNSTERKQYFSILKWENAENCALCSYSHFCPHCVGVSKAETRDLYACNTCDRLIAECINELQDNYHGGSN